MNKKSEMFFENEGKMLRKVDGNIFQDLAKD